MKQMTGWTCMRTYRVKGSRQDEAPAVSEAETDNLPATKKSKTCIDGCIIVIGAVDDISAYAVDFHPQEKWQHPRRVQRNAS
jgi:hypothetical protein